MEYEIIAYYQKIIHDFGRHKKVYPGKYFNNVHYKALTCDIALQFDDIDNKFM